MKLVSVIIPVYNVEKYIIKCLESVIAQDYRDFEIILVNDGSTDASADLIRDFFRDKDLKWTLIQKENGGLASARNAGLKRAEGEFISFVDSDDTISRDFLSSMVSELKNDDIDFCFCNFEFTKNQDIPEDHNEKKEAFNRDELLKVFLKRTIGFVVPSMVFRKEFIMDNDLFFDEGIRFSEDQPFIWKTILHSNRSVYLYKKMYGYYIRNNSIMTATSKEKLISSFNEFRNNIQSLFSNYPEYADISRLILPRWKLGALYSASVLLNYKDFKELYRLMEGKKIFGRMLRIGEWKAILLGLFSLSPGLLYIASRKLKRNE